MCIDLAVSLLFSPMLPPGSVHRAYRDIPHKWARSIGPTGLIPADHGDKRSRYVLIWLFLYCLALCSPPGSVHRAYRDIPHKWAPSIGPTETFLTNVLGP